LPKLTQGLYLLVPKAKPLFMPSDVTFDQAMRGVVNVPQPKVEEKSKLKLWFKRAKKKKKSGG
jgi:hypothetical protein